MTIVHGIDENLHTQYMGKLTLFYRDNSNYDIDIEEILRHRLRTNKYTDVFTVNDKNNSPTLAAYIKDDYLLALFPLVQQTSFATAKQSNFIFKQARKLLGIDTLKFHYTSGMPRYAIKRSEDTDNPKTTERILFL